MSRLRLAYPLLQIGFWLGMIALFLVVLRAPRRPILRVAATSTATACVAAGMYLAMRVTPAALDVLTGVSISFQMSGALLAWAGLGAALVSLLLQTAGD